MSDRSITPGEVIGRLDALAEELGKVSNALATVERQLEPVDREFREFVDNHEIGLYERSITEDGFKLPAEALRQKLAVRAMPPELYGRRTALVHSRDRAVRRIATLKVEIDAQRSILSALKEELAATR